MKWVAFTVLVVVAGAVAALAIYTWGWRETGRSAAEEEDLAQAYAEQVAFLVCDNERESQNPLVPGPCDPSVSREAPGVWRFSVEDECYVIDLDHFASRLGGLPTGVARVRC